MIDSGPTDRAFGLMFGGVFAVIGIGAWTLFDSLLAWAFGVSAGFFLIALVAPGVLLPLNRLWALFGQRLNRVTNFALLGLLFYLVAFPMAMLLRLFGRDPMNRRFEPDGDTYLTPVGRHTSPQTLEDLF